MASQAYAEVIEFPAFLTRQRPVVPYREDSPCNEIKARPGDLLGAAGRFLRFAGEWFAAGISARVINMRNGMDSMANVQGIASGVAAARRPDVSQGIGESPRPANPSPNPRSLVDDVASAVDRLRRIEGERGLYIMLESLLQGSRSVLVQHGVMPPQEGSAELESLRHQLKLAQEARDINHAYAKHYADTLSKIQNLDGSEDLQDAQKIAKGSLEAVISGQPAK